jgi:hypothetical protein
MTELHCDYNTYIYRGHSYIYGIDSKIYDDDTSEETIINDFTFTIPDGFIFVTLHEIGELSYSNTTSKYIYNSIKEIGYNEFTTQITNIINSPNQDEITQKIDILKMKMIKLYLIKLNSDYVEPKYKNLIIYIDMLFNEMISCLITDNLINDCSVTNCSTTNCSATNCSATNCSVTNCLKEKKDIIDKQIAKLCKTQYESLTDYVKLIKDIRAFLESNESITNNTFTNYIDIIKNIKKNFLAEIDTNLKNHFVKYFNVAFNNIAVVEMIYNKKKEYSTQILQNKAWSYLTSATFSWIDDDLIDTVVKTLNFNINIFTSGSRMYKLHSNMELSHKNTKTDTRTIYYNGFWPLKNYLQLDNYSYEVNEADKHFDINSLNNRNKYRSNLYPYLINNDTIYLNELLELSDENREKLISLHEILKSNPQKIIDHNEYNQIIHNYAFINNLVGGFNFTNKTYAQLLINTEAYLTKLNPGIYIFNTCGNISNNALISVEAKIKIIDVLNSIKLNKNN